MNDQFLVGHIKSIVIADPAAGAEFSYTIPAGQRIHVGSLSFTYTSDANVATRQVSIFVDRDGSSIFPSVAQATQLASLIRFYSFAPGNRDMAAMINDYITVPIPSTMILIPGDILYSFTPLGAAGDLYTDINLQVESFLLP